MSSEQNGILEGSRSWWTALWGDIQFWVPFIVLLLGFFLLWFVR
jgi:hypothetical protein